MWNNVPSFNECMFSRNIMSHLWNDLITSTHLTCLPYRHCDVITSNSFDVMSHGPRRWGQGVEREESKNYCPLGGYWIWSLILHIYFLDERILPVLEIQNASSTCSISPCNNKLINITDNWAKIYVCVVDKFDINS